MNPLTGLVLAGSGAVACLAWAHWAVWLAVLAASVGAAAAGRVLGKAVAAALVVVVPFALWALAIHGLFFPEGHTVLASFGPARVTAEGLEYAGGIVLRTAALVVVMLAFSTWVEIPVLRAALVRRGVPAQLGYVLATALGLASTVAERLERIREAQEARGLVVRKSLGGRFVAARLQVVPLVLQLVDEAGERAAALEARGQTLPGRRTSYVDEPDSRGQRVLRWVLAMGSLAVVLAVVVSAVARVLGGGR
ncbi:energy-coupling factor transporter transmembrane component T [Sinomonas sp. JGH33]|uniref:Energy-coupling factor transporter transmembrane component T n=1 Tax=Sinomonas terricola TaxID=3110330 RepID=A0ABU5T3Q3_9MICC|nr:energy-coupling factor transporter transmembrane component T [Sinomonas sp. JGH33]MEA5454291.1 energy-coupling factor transporter transmembrane component T [Sinomonas sp. JGH33]